MKILSALVIIGIILMLSLSAFPVYAQQYPANMIAYWKFDESAGTTACDSSGNGNIGTLLGASTWVPGIAGNALSFVAENDYVDAGYNDIFNFNNGSGDFTIDAWIKPTLMPSFASAIVAKATESPFSGWSFYFYGQNDGAHPAGSLGFGGNGAWEITSNANTIIPGEWAHVAVTKTGGSYTLYKNGVVVASVAHGNLETSTTSLKIGRDYPDGSPDLFGFNGFIDEVEICSTALSQAEILRHYQNGLNGLGYYSQPPVINSVMADPDQLWPPNNKNVAVTIVIEMSDPDGPQDINRITYSVTDEYGIYNVAETDLPANRIISLKASRDGKDKDGRIYEILITVYDASGLSASSSVNVIVPHDQSK